MTPEERLREADKQLVLASDRLDDDARAALVGELADSVRALADEVEDAQESEIATDGGTTGYARCPECKQTYDSIAAARMCCSDNGDDDGSEGTPLLADGGALTENRGGCHKHRCDTCDRVFDNPRCGQSCPHCSGVALCQTEGVKRCR